MSCAHWMLDSNCSTTWSVHQHTSYTFNKKRKLFQHWSNPGLHNSEIGVLMIRHQDVGDLPCWSSDSCVHLWDARLYSAHAACQLHLGYAMTDRTKWQMGITTDRNVHGYLLQFFSCNSSDIRLVVHSVGFKKYYWSLRFAEITLISNESHVGSFSFHAQQPMKAVLSFMSKGQHTYWRPA